MSIPRGDTLREFRSWSAAWLILSEREKPCASPTMTWIGALRARTQDLARAVEALEGEVAQQEDRAKTPDAIGAPQSAGPHYSALANGRTCKVFFRWSYVAWKTPCRSISRCVCLYDAVGEELAVTCVGVRSEALAMELALTEQARIALDRNGLSRCVAANWSTSRTLARWTSHFPAALERRIALDGGRAPDVRKQGLRRSNRSPATGEQLQQRRVRIFAAVERARRAGGASSPDLHAPCSTHTTISARRSKP